MNSIGFIKSIYKCSLSSTHVLSIQIGIAKMTTTVVLTDFFHSWWHFRETYAIMG